MRRISLNDGWEVRPRVHRFAELTGEGAEWAPVTLPHDALGAFMTRVRACVASLAPDARVWLFGHAGDGNLHVNVTGVDPDDERITDAVLHIVAELHGSISAEHGIGTAKRAWVHLTRSPEELAVFRAIKQALDPRGTLNPNVLLP